MDVSTDTYLQGVKTTLDRIPMAKVKELGALLAKARDTGKRVYICGNGDSFSNSLHYALDLAKGIRREDKKPLKIKELASNTPLLTAFGNDTSYSNIFKGELEVLLEKGDLVIGISGSGNSPNVLEAVEYANKNGATTVGITGYSGGKLKNLAQVSVHVPVDNMELAEDAHWIIGHVLKMYLMEH